MRIDTLRRALDRHARVKVFVVLDDSCLCGYAARNTDTKGDLVVTIGASVRCVYATMTVEESRFHTGSLLLSNATKVTRRVQTHRRHLVGRDVPEQYFVRAMAL